MARYLNAKDFLSDELILQVLERIPKGCRSSALIYFSEDYYARRNAEVVRCFQIYESDPAFGSHVEIYEALSEQFGLGPRRICRILERRTRECERHKPGRRRHSSVRVVGRAMRRMRIRPVAP
ncbi:hypothetical protein HZA56_21570 [Candidatus Poribacteria bacterium]|nr:hypothetical protein [Candidatus Poribacteria bacterium]